MKFFKSFLILTALFFLKNDSTKAYYFQLSDLSTSIIFKYECKSDTSKTEYWKLTSNTKKNTLITEAYSNDLKKYEFFVEEFNSDGSKVLKFISYHWNKIGEIEVIKNNLKEVDVFKWKKDQTYCYSSEYIDGTYGKVSFSKCRTFLKEEVLTILGKDYPVLKFKGVYKTKIPGANYDDEYYQYSYYAQGLGLVKMEKNYPNGKTTVLELTEIISNDDWEKKLN
ncbi:hypothetical protein [uncultured Psychroserpens sp.]|uniref:hypothetical protein n=1 Tax=uncultured Psychroserpens sp. TaxID=255436 RepID=UPI00262406F8|nr:hypothetical protein [uncultured Psychroserpens sp.]